MRHWKRILLAVVAVVIIVSVVFAVSLRQFLHSPAEIPQEGLSFEIEAGSSFRTVSSNLAELGIINRPANRYRSRYLILNLINRGPNGGFCRSINIE